MFKSNAGLPKRVLSMVQRASRHVLAPMAFVSLLALSACGDTGATGLGSVQINDGGDAAFDIAQTNAAVCDFSGWAFFFRILAFKTDADVGEIIFGSDTILDIQQGAPSSQPLVDAVVVMLGVDNVFQVQHSNDPNAPFFINPALVLNTTTGVTTFSTGDHGVSYVVVSTVGGPLIAAGGDETRGFVFEPSLGGDGYGAEFNFTCDTP